MQFLYVFFVGSFPFNSFLSGFFCSLGFFVLMGKLPGTAQPDGNAVHQATILCAPSQQSVTMSAGPFVYCAVELPCGRIRHFVFYASAVSLRMQVDPQSTEFKSLLLERAYADVLLCGFLLFLIVWNFMG